MLQNDARMSGHEIQCLTELPDAVILLQPYPSIGEALDQSRTVCESCDLREPMPRHNALKKLGQRSVANSLGQAAH